MLNSCCALKVYVDVYFVMSFTPNTQKYCANKLNSLTQLHQTCLTCYTELQICYFIYQTATRLVHCELINLYCANIYWHQTHTYSIQHFHELCTLLLTTLYLCYKTLTCITYDAATSNTAVQTETCVTVHRELFTTWDFSSIGQCTICMIQHLNTYIMVVKAINNEHNLIDGLEFHAISPRNHCI